MATRYKSIRLPDFSIPWRDGPALMSYKNKLWLVMGWGVGLPESYRSNTKEIWSSVDKGETWIKETSFPGTARHTFGCQKLNGKIYVYGVDHQFYSDPGTADVWSFDGTTWTQILADLDAVVGRRVLYGHTVHRGYLYIMGGQLRAGLDTYINDIYRSLDGINWEKVADLPPPLQDRATPLCISFGNKLYYGGGFQYLDGTPKFTDIWVSENGGLSWDFVGDLPFGSGYSNPILFDGKFFILHGGNSDLGGDTNLIALHYTEDFKKYYEFTTNKHDHTHASGVCVHDDKLFIAMGNDTKQLVYIEKEL